MANDEDRLTQSHYAHKNQNNSLGEYFILNGRGRKTSGAKSVEEIDIEILEMRWKRWRMEEKKRINTLWPRRRRMFAYVNGDDSSDLHK